MRNLRRSAWKAAVVLCVGVVGSNLPVLSPNRVLADDIPLDSIQVPLDSTSPESGIVPPRSSKLGFRLFKSASSKPAPTRPNVGPIKRSFARLQDGFESLPRPNLKLPTLKGPKSQLHAQPATVSDEPKSLLPSQKADMAIAAARMAEGSGDIEKAIELYLSAIEQDRQRTDASVRMAILHDQQGKFEEADKIYQMACEVAPSNSDLHCAYGYSLYLRGRLDKAEEQLRQAIQLRTGDARAHNNLGLVLAQAGHPDEAIKEFRAGGCSESQSRANLAYAMALNGQWEEARREFERVLRADPKSDTAREGLRVVDRLSRQSVSKNVQPASATIERPRERR